MVNGGAAACGEEKFDLPEGIVRFSDILNRDGSLVEIGSRSVAGSSQRGRVVGGSGEWRVASGEWRVASGVW